MMVSQVISVISSVIGIISSVINVISSVISAVTLMTSVVSSARGRTVSVCVSPLGELSIGKLATHFFLSCINVKWTFLEKEDMNTTRNQAKQLDIGFKTPPLASI